MLNKIIRFSLNNRLLVVAAAVLLTVWGIYTAGNTEVDVFPDLNAPTVVVMTEAGGMAAEDVEQLVTFPVETAVNGAANVRRVRSSSTAGFSVVWIEFDWDTDVYVARQIVSEKLAAIGDELPSNVGTPVLGPQSSILGEILIIGMTADTTSMLDLRTLADKTIRPRLLTVGGVAQVSVIGGDVREYQILVHPEKMRHYGVSLSEILAAVRGMNNSSSGGVVYEYGNEYIVRGDISTDDIHEMEKAVVRNTGGTPVRLADVAEVRIGAQQPRLGLASEKCRPAVLLTVTKQPNTGTIELTEQLESVVRDLKKNMPADIRVSTDIFRQADFIEGSVRNVRSSLYEGAFFVVLVLFLFLANVRTTVISLVTLPLSLIVALLVLHYMGFSVNTMSLGGMAIAIGSLVDDAIVDVENVWKHLRANRLLPENERKHLVEVVFNASREVRMPILNSTLIIVASFVPLFFLSGMEGRMLVPLGIAFIVSLFASTLVALTLTPVLCSMLLGGKKQESGVPKEAFVAVWLKKGYVRLLLWTLDHKRTVVGGTIVLFVAALAVFFTLGYSFLPAFNEGSFTINISSLPGISLDESDKIGRQAEELLLSVPEIRTVARKTGRAELDEHALGVNVSEIEAPFVLDGRSHHEVLDEVREKLSAIKGANIEIGQPVSHRIDAMLSGTQASIAIKLFGDDLNNMFLIANRIRNAIHEVEGIADLNVEQQVERPEIRVVPDREMLARNGITLPQFSECLSVCLSGETVAQVYEDGRSVDLVVRADDGGGNTMERMLDMMVDCPDGRKIPLSDVARVISTSGPNTINRENVKRKVVISANTSGRDVGSVVSDIKRIVESDIQLPEGCHIEYGGQFENARSAGRVLLCTSLASIVVIFLLLYMQFGNATESGVILLNLPLALIGGVFALACTSGEVSIPAIIGFISLFGIATRNGMLLITRYNGLRHEGMGTVRDCVVTGSSDRLNPILMTALTSALALIPLALNGELPGNEIQSPMAKVILGGLLTSTFLNVFIVPIVYEWINEKER
ncbi:MAG: efflux RND transporter permease subunit [Bacteroides sp.]|nr:efflux RND transporter permease subunit [Roseburia sp.]MCM1347680.1 efflux RND transporter permease subunit [Bacteroides sp.]MCM1422113.1 efflux RND transporter permease subunit [Bacteroides sp.]